MKLEIDDIYSDEGRKLLIDAYTKSMWTDGVFRRSSWLGVPVLQIPEDMVALADLIWTVKPKLIIECGIFRGGGLIFYSSLLRLIGDGYVIGIDVSPELAEPIMQHPMADRISIVSGDSGDPGILSRIDPALLSRGEILVILDSDHSAGHVRRELRAFAPIIQPGGYIVVMDGIMEILDDVPGGEPHWKRNNPETAIREFLSLNPDFERDHRYNRLGSSFAPGGFLRRVIPSLPEESPGGEAPRR